MFKKIFVYLFFIFVVAFILRVLYLKDLSLIFGYDQGRDAFVTKEILGGDLKILGPPSSTPGLYHGVFYYYFLAPAYLFGKSSPIAAAYWTALFNAFGVFLVFGLTYLISKNVKTSFISSMIFAISYEATQYATWLSNPTLGIWTIPLIYIGLWLWINEAKDLKKYIKFGPVITAVGLGLSIQSEIFLAYHIVPVIIWLWIKRKNVKKGELITAFTVLLLTVSTLIAAEFKFGFKGVGGVLSLAGVGKQDSVLIQKDLGDFVILYINQLGKTIANNLFPSNLGYGGALGLILVFYLYGIYKKNKDISIPFVLTYLFSHLPVVTMGGVSTPFLTVGIGAAVAIVAAMAISDIYRKNPGVAKVLLLLILVSNLITVITRNRKGQQIFAIQRDMILANELPAIDYIYKDAGGKQFNIDSLTSPFWVNTTWSYLFNWYGVEKYGYLPSWWGRDQVGQLGNNLKPADSGNTLLYFIKEPTQGIPGHLVEAEESIMNTKTKLIEKKTFGELSVEKREIIKFN